MREAMETVLIQRNPLAICHEAIIWQKAARGSRSRANKSPQAFRECQWRQHILVGTYEMRPFRKATHN